MHHRWRIISTLSALLFLGMLLAFLPVFVSASHQSPGPLPSPVPPEPYPNSDIYPAVVYLDNLEDLQLLYALNIDMEDLRPVDGDYAPGIEFEPSIATIYINPTQAQSLAQAGLPPVPIPNQGYRGFLDHGPGSSQPGGWPTFEEYVARMQALEVANPTIVRVIPIGSSVQGRGIYCIKISDNLDEEENEPEFKYSASLHGTETTGIEMTVRLAEHLANSYGIDPLLTDMVDKMEIWLCPISNPDGYVLGTYYNAHNVNLNRDFPDRFLDPVDDPSGREPETRAFMYLEYDHRFVMGANYHGGAQVLNYPWDATAASNPPVPDYAPDDDLFHDLGIGYTSRNSYLLYGGWLEGITRGWEWYQIWGGMQDWAYFYHNEHHVTLEISDDPNPPFTDMALYWEQNRDAMLWWMQRAWTGLGGLVLDARDLSPLDASVVLLGREEPNTILTDPEVGDYNRVISEGTHTLEASATGYISQQMDVTVISGTLTTHDFYLCPEQQLVVSGSVTEAVSGQPLEAMVEFLGSHQVVNSDPDTGVYSIEVCPATYTMRVSAPWHYLQERQVTVDHSQVQDFALVPTSNLSPSNKTATTTHPLPAEVVQYQLHVSNLSGVTSATVTDTLPISVTWTGFLTATQGIPVFEAGQILWQGEVTQSQPVTITYAVTVNQCLPAGTAFLNLAHFSDGVNGVVTSKVVSQVDNAAPSLPAAPNPMDGTTRQPVSITLSWAPSTDLNCDAITYDLYLGTSPTPPLVGTGLTTSDFTPGGLLPGTTYYWSVVALDGYTQTPGPVWSFSTSGARLFLPVMIK